MTSIYPVNRPQPNYPKNLRHLSHLKLQRISSIDSTASAVSTPRTYASARREEKEKDELHASGGTWIELFYDLFFAASLSSFSRTREISGRADLVDLAAYFTILWWTWTSQTLFDVRHSQHAKSEKFMKFLQLLIMVGYGVFEGDFSLFSRTMAGEGQTGSIVVPRHRSAPRTSMIAIVSLFIVSRFLLGAQYLRIAVRKRKDESLVLQIQNSALVSAALPIIAGLLWMTSLFVPDAGVGLNGIFASRTSLWVVGILVEMIGTFAMRLHKRGGFEKSHLSERYGSLTIIILGEGIIKLVSVLRDISSGVGFEIKSVVAIVSSVVSFYLIFALYFDDFSLHERINSVRAYSWAYTHYLFHLSLVLCLDGITSLLLFTNIFGGIQQLLSSDTESGILEHLLNYQIVEDHLDTAPLTLGRITFAYNSLSTTMSHNGTELSQSEYNYVFINLFERVFQSYNVMPSEGFLDFLRELEPGTVGEDDLTTAFKLLLGQFVVSAQFFLLAGGFIFLTMVPLMYWQKRLLFENWSKWLPLGARSVVGLVMVAIGLLVDTNGAQLGRGLMAGALIPFFMVAAMVVYMVDRVVVRYLQFK